MRSRTDSRLYRARHRLLPSTSGDPFLARLTGEVPSGDSVVVSKAILKDSGLDLGDRVSLRVTRIVSDKRANVQFDVTIGGWVPDDTIDVPAILADPRIERQVEAYRAGIAVPERGWEGVNAEPAPSFARILIVAPDGLGATLETETKVRVGAITATRVDTDEIAELIGAGEVDLPSAAHFLMLDAGGDVYSERDVSEANTVLSNSTAHAVGVTLARQATLLGRDLRVAALPEGLGALPITGDLPDVHSRGRGYVLNDAIALPESLRNAWEAQGASRMISVRFAYPKGAGTEELDVNLRVAGFYSGRVAIVSSALLGLVSRGDQIALDFDPVGRRFVELGAGFRGFRIVGDDIDRIPALVARFEAEGIDIRAKSSQILKLQRLEQSLNLLVLVVATVALTGGVSILTSSFFTNV